jgi:hypothetical protein
MQAFKFETEISENGTIFLPFIVPDLFGKEVEIFIVPKEEKPMDIKKASAKNFVSRWAGFMKDKNIDFEKTKYEYLSEKYK